VDQSKIPEFYSLDNDTMEELLKSNNINVESEMPIVNVLESWLKHSEERYYIVLLKEKHEFDN